MPLRRDAVLAAAARLKREALPDPEFFSEEAAAAFLSLSPRTLEKYRRAGVGPPAIRIGKHVRYSRRAIESWAEKLAGGRS